MAVINLSSFKDVTKRIERLALDYGISYIDAVVHYCEHHDIEIEFIGEIINQNPSLKSKIELEASELHFLKTRVT